MKYGKGRLGLACFQNINGQAEKIMIDVIMISKQEFNHNVTSEENLKIVILRFNCI